MTTLRLFPLARTGLAVATFLAVACTGSDESSETPNDGGADHRAPPNILPSDGAIEDPTRCRADIDGVGTRGLSPPEASTLRAALEQLAASWTPEARNTGFAMLQKAEYSADDYAAFFHEYFVVQNHPLNDSITPYIAFLQLGEPAQRKIQMALIVPLWNRINQLMASHATNLGRDMAADSALQLNLMNAHGLLDVSMNGAVDGCGRAIAYQAYREHIARYPQYFGEGRLDPVAQPRVAILRAQVRMTFRDSQVPTPEVKAVTRQLLGLSGRYLDLYNERSMLVHDNQSFTAAQLNAIHALVGAIPGTMLDLRNILQAELLGDTSGEWIHRYRGRGAINIANIQPGTDSGPSFPPDIEQRQIDGFQAFLAHEANHIVDAVYISGDPARAARRDALLRQAGSDDLQFLRSQVGAAYFQGTPLVRGNPQEFVASIANEWFTDSAHTLTLGLRRFDGGRREPLNQALFFVELYSMGGPTSRFYRIGTDATVHTELVPVVRDARGRITAVTLAGRRYSFTLDADGNVTAYAASS